MFTKHLYFAHGQLHRQFSLITLKSLFVAALFALMSFNASAGVIWPAPVRLATDQQTQGILNPDVATNANGQQVSVWVQGGQIQSRFYQNGVWESPIILSQAVLGVSNPAVALTDAGQAVAVWLQSHGAGLATVQASFYSDGIWGQPITVSNTGMNATSPKVGFSGTGQATLAWSEADSSGTQCGIMVATGAPLGDWSTAQSLSSSCHAYVWLSVNSGGEAAVAWSDVSGLNGAGVYVASRDLNGNWEAAATLTPPQYRQYLPGLALGEDGTAVAVWNNAYTGLMWSRKPRGGHWSTAAAVNPNYYNFATGADVAVDGQGNATAVFLVWTMTPSGSIAYPLQAAQLKAGAGTWNKASYVTGKSQNIYNFAVDVDATGRLVVGWSDGGTGKSGAASLFPGETRWTNAILGKGGYEVSVDISAGSAAMLWNNTYAPVSLNVSSAVIATASLGSARALQHVGVVGCSLTNIAVAGYYRLGGSLLWPSTTGYGGGTISAWAQDLSAHSVYWQAFDATFAANRATNAVWLQLCTSTYGAAQDNFENAQLIVNQIHGRIPGSQVFVSAQNSYSNGYCEIAGPNGPARMQAIADQLVAAQLAKPGPVLGPLSMRQTSDSCHANPAGALVLGAQLKAFF